MKITLTCYDCGTRLTCAGTWEQALQQAKSAGWNVTSTDGEEWCPDCRKLHALGFSGEPPREESCRNTD